jgi:hypothetical protein
VHRSRKDIQAEKIGSQDLDQENRGHRRNAPSRAICANTSYVWCSALCLG